MYPNSKPPDWDPLSAGDLSAIQGATTRVKAASLAQSGIENVRVLSESRFLHLVRRMVEASVEKRLRLAVSSLGGTPEEPKMNDSFQERLVGLSEAEKRVLREELKAVYETEINGLRGELESRRHEGRRDRQQQSEQLGQLNEELLTREREIARLKEEVALKNEALQRLGRSDGDLVEKLVCRLNQRLEGMAHPSELRDLKQFLDQVNQNLAGIAAVRDAIRKAANSEDEALVRLAQNIRENVELESNMSAVQVKQARSKGVADSLAKLRRTRELHNTESALRADD
jgi:hypothetical protein